LGGWPTYGFDLVFGRKISFRAPYMPAYFAGICGTRESRQPVRFGFVIAATPQINNARLISCPVGGWTPLHRVGGVYAAGDWLGNKLRFAGRLRFAHGWPEGHPSRSRPCRPLDATVEAVACFSPRRAGSPSREWRMRFPAAPPLRLRSGQALRTIGSVRRMGHPWFVSSGAQNQNRTPIHG